MFKGATISYSTGYKRERICYFTLLGLYQGILRKKNVDHLCKINVK